MSDVLTKYRSSLIAVDGQYVVLPKWKGGQTGWGNLAIPNPYELEQYAKYPIGTKFVDDDRRWRYVQAGNTCTAGRVLQSWNAYSTPTSGNGTTRETTTIAAAASDGDTTITCTELGSVTKNIFAGGYFLVYWEFQSYRIQENTLAATTFTVTMDLPLDQDISGSSVVSIYRDKYADVRYLSAGNQAGFGSGVCVPHKTITDEYYAWGQTWGPCGLAGTDNAGATANERGMSMMTDGSIYQTTGIHASNNQPQYQYIGHLISYTGPGATGVDQPGALFHVELQLAP